MPAEPGLRGGIDLGGTKIAAALFDAAFEPRAQRFAATPAEYPALLDALAAAMAWLRAEAGDVGLPIGLGMPGLTDPEDGAATTANLPATGRSLAADARARAGGVLAVENDCKCFTLSEANGGAGGAGVVFGLILGTGIGGGVATGGRLWRGASGLPGEVGHIGIPAATLAGHGLPVLACKCGRAGCFETYMSGPGVARLAQALTGAPVPAPELAARFAAGAPEAVRVMRAWSAIAGEMLHMLQLTIDPDWVVLGGGLANMPGIAALMLEGFMAAKLAPTRTPRVVPARFPALSGARGAAMLNP